MKMLESFPRNVLTFKDFLPFLTGDAGDAEVTRWEVSPGWNWSNRQLQFLWIYDINGHYKCCADFPLNSILVFQETEIF